MTNEKPFPLAIEAPDAKVTAFTAEMLTKASALARQSPRGRIIQRLHKRDDAPLQRMFNVMQPGSYARPHRHCTPPKAETFIVLSGAVRFVEFNDRGDIIQCLEMRPGSATFGVDIEPGVCHTLIVLEPDTILFEVKNGPYSLASDKDFAHWSPAEGTPESARFLAELIKQTGGMPSGPGRGTLTMGDGKPPATQIHPCLSERHQGCHAGSTDGLMTHSALMGRIRRQRRQADDRVAGHEYSRSA